jgi:mannose-6-phosphate isomerase-like protein (cupin superfamily)
MVYRSRISWGHIVEVLDRVCPSPTARGWTDCRRPVRYPALHVVDLAAEGATVTEPYRNMVISRVNDSCLRLAVFDEAYRWHYHPASDELFVVVDGCLAIDLADNRELHLRPWQCVTIPAMTRHRTRALGRTVNLCFEKLGAETIFIDSPSQHS